MKIKSRNEIRKRETVARHKLIKKINKDKKRNFKNKLEAWKLRIIKRDNWICQVTKKKLLTRKECHPHHIISLNSVIKKYPDLLEDDNNGILLGAYAHKFAPNSAHQSSLEFVLWLQKHKSAQYNYLVNFINKNIK